MDPVATMTGISIPLSAQTVRDFFWNGESVPPKVPEDSNPSKGADPRLVNLSESREKRREFDNPDFSLHLVTNITLVDNQGNTQPLSVLSTLSLEEGDRLARYLSACVLSGEANVPKQEYLDTLADTNPAERDKITANSVINRYIFNAPQGTPIKYIYAVNRKLMAEDARIFQEK